jgi:hypothetical protein
MDDKSRVMIAAVFGAVAGATLGYLYLTAAGQRIRAQLEPKLDDFVGEIRRVRGTIDKARSAADEGWRSLNDITGSRGGGRWGQGVSR